MKPSAALLVILLAACDQADRTRVELPPDSLAMRDSAAAAARAEYAQRERASQQGVNRFDALQLRRGDTLLGLRVKSTTVQPAISAPYAGSVAFEGEVEVSGEYRPHFDYPEVRVPCFWVAESDGRKLPRARGDTRIVWFCFQNEAVALEKLGDLDARVRATVVVDEYTTNLQQSDVWDSARLVRVVRKGETQR